MKSGNTSFVVYLKKIRWSHENSNCLWFCFCQHGRIKKKKKSDHIFDGNLGAKFVLADTAIYLVTGAQHLGIKTFPLVIGAGFDIILVLCA
jgi:hypothetical protein